MLYEVITIDWDAAVNLKDKKIGVGAIVRNVEGEVLASLCDVFPLCSSLDLAKATALRRAVMFCIELGLPSVCLEGDAQVVIKAVQSKEAIATDYGVLIEDIRKLLLERKD